MSARKLLVLGIAAVLALAAGLWLAGRQVSSEAGDTRAALYPGLESELDAIEAVRIFKAGDARAVELKRGEGGWTVTERAGYRADEAKLGLLVRAIADAEIVEEKTSNPERHAALGVEDTAKQDAKGVRVELSGPAKPVNLIVGNAGAGASSRFVRRAGEKQSWLIDQALDASSAPEAWLAKDIVDIESDRLQSATVTVKGERPYTASKGSLDDANFGIEKLPKGKSLRSPSAANGIATALSALTLTDVQAKDAFGSEPRADHARFATFDGLLVEVDGWKRDDKRFIALRASFDAAQAKRFAAGAAEGKAKPAALNVEEEAKSLAAKTAGWVYEIPGYRYESLLKPIEELL
ncbi:MAG: DUF4340 domain-containing protein [Steroidobacteraceae bacterium]